MQTILIATTNPGKVAEIAEAMSGLEFSIVGLAEIANCPEAPEEIGETFEENALLKAEYYHLGTGLMTLADDSGLSVDALGGRPGVHSARYGGAGIGSERQIELLLEELRDVPESLRGAEFVCSIALVGRGIRKTFDGCCRGVISTEPRGTGGFGYDPIFLIPGLELCFAELDRRQKSAISHRGQALAKCREFLATLPAE